MSQIIKPRERIITPVYSYEFSYVAEPGAGYSFQSNKKGEILIQNDAQRDSLALAREGVANGTMVEDGARVYMHHHTEPAILRCDCYREIELYDPLYNECACGQGWNGSGQRLAPIELWEPVDAYSVFGPREDY